ncbi:MAG: PQQ-binding-like beta-propeller repeat protein [Phycisphaerae bacterium]|nr:PQQ-binding-like beta-propeller repeat protein [Phycisphaerae bacterium]
MKLTRSISRALLAVACHSPTALAQSWTHFAGGPSRTSSNASALAPGAGVLSSPLWTVSHDPQGRAITFVGQSTPVVSPTHVLAISSIQLASKQFSLYAIDRRTGVISWAAPIASPAFDSWSSPALDLEHNAAIVSSGTTLASFDLSSGALKWSRALAAPVVNASPVVTSDLLMRDRVLITEYDGFADGARLVCVNIDPFDAAFNPHQPGEIVWTFPLGQSSGDTVAYHQGRAYVGTMGDPGYAPGSILCFDVLAGPTPLWSFDNVIDEGFFAAPVVHQPIGRAAYVLAASYAFSGGRESANLVKLDAHTGEMVWSAACNRTGATPIVLPGGRVALSGGLRGYGTLPTLQLFADHTTWAEPLWDSAFNTWTDTNANGQIDLGEFVVMGGWTHQPALAAGHNILFVGATPTSGSSYSPCTDLYALDITKLPTTPGNAQPGFIATQRSGVGSAPALDSGTLYSIGVSGLQAFGPPPPRTDVNADGLTDIEDLYSWEQGRGERDVNRDSFINALDRTELLRALRADEREDMSGHRP